MNTLGRMSDAELMTLRRQLQESIRENWSYDQAEKAGYALDAVLEELENRP